MVRILVILLALMVASRFSRTATLLQRHDRFLPDLGHGMATPEMAQTLDELKSLGVNSIAIHPYARIQEDGQVVAGRRAGANTTHITMPLRWARERGMSAMLIPHIAYWGTKFSWRGEIKFDTPEEWDRFFRRLRNLDRRDGARWRKASRRKFFASASSLPTRKSSRSAGAKSSPPCARFIAAK